MIGAAECDERKHSHELAPSRLFIASQVLRRLAVELTGAWRIRSPASGVVFERAAQIEHVRRRPRPPHKIIRRSLDFEDAKKRLRVRCPGGDRRDLAPYPHARHPWRARGAQTTCKSAIPFVIRIYRRAIESNAFDAACALDALLRSVVTGYAQRLPIALIEEQRTVSLVWLDMVDDLGGAQTASLLAHATQRMRAQVRITELAPGASIQMRVFTSIIDQAISRSNCTGWICPPTVVTMH